MQAFVHRYPCSGKWEVSVGRPEVELDAAFCDFKVCERFLRVC